MAQPDFRSLLRRYWPVWLVLILLILAWWPGRQLFMHIQTEREASRIADITPAEVATEIPQRLALDRLITDLTWLAHSDREGRAPGTEGGLAARQYIQERFAELGLEQAGEEGFLQPFTMEETNDAANIVARIPGQHPERGAIALTAHYDHLGVRDGEIYHGADDNASGTAALLEIARYLTEREQSPQHDILLIALDAEEWGLQGAQALFSEGLFTADDIAFNVNMDMLSRDTDELLYAVGTYHYPWVAPLVQRVQQESGARLVMAHDRPWYLAGHTPDWTHSSDHGPFHDQGIPFIYFGVADHSDYHQPTDTADRADPEFFRRTAETALSFLLLVDQVLAEK